MTVSPRLLLFCCDYQEELNSLSLKQHGSTYDCTKCIADSESFAGRQWVNEQRIDVIYKVTAQLDGARMRKEHGNTAAVKETEPNNGIHCRVPDLAGWAGLGSGCQILYQVTGFDRLHVCEAPLPSFARAPVHFVLSFFHFVRVVKSPATEERAHGLPPLSSTPAAPHSIFWSALSDCCGIFLLSNRFLTSDCPVDCQTRRICAPSSSKMRSASLRGHQALLCAPLTCASCTRAARIPFRASTQSAFRICRVMYLCAPASHMSPRQRGRLSFWTSSYTCGAWPTVGGQRCAAPLAYTDLHTSSCLGPLPFLMSSFASLPWRSYIVAPDKTQATLRIAEHRRAMRFLPFAVSAILGAATGR